ncbi:MAG: lysophospholipase [Polyangia bacterium]
MDTYDCTAKDGTKLVVYHWPCPAARAQVLVLHGYGEHAQRYDELAQTFVAAGYDVVAPDLRGHGRSGGVRHFVQDFSSYFDDFDIVAAKADELCPRLPRFLLGHSFGGLLALAEVIDRMPKLVGLVLSSPFLRVKLSVPAWKLLAAKVAAKLYPQLTLPSGLSGAAVARDPEIAARYDADPLNGKGATAGWFVESQKMQQHVFDEAARVTLPVLLLHGEADVVADPARSAEIFPRLGSEDKTLALVTGAFHEIFNEPPVDRRRIMARVVSWLDAHRP